jgi:hypothetical protein
VVSDKKIFKISANENTLWTLAAKSGRGPSSEHFWQVWLISVQRFQRRRFKCEKLTDGRTDATHDKSSPGLWPGELKMMSLGLTQTSGTYISFSAAMQFVHPDFHPSNFPNYT